MFKGANDIVADPQFIDVQLNPVQGNFRLAKTSRGLNSGSAELPVSADITGKAPNKIAVARTYPTKSRQTGSCQTGVLFSSK